MKPKSESVYTIHIMVQPGSAQYEVEVRSGITIGALKRGIIENPQFGIPRIDAFGHPIIYRMLNKTSSKSLDMNDVVDGDSVASNDVIILAPESVAGNIVNYLRSDLNVRPRTRRKYSILVYVHNNQATYEWEVKTGTTVTELERSMLENPAFGLNKIHSEGDGHRFQIVNLSTNEILKSTDLVDGDAIESGDTIALIPEDLIKG